MHINSLRTIVVGAALLLVAVVALIGVTPRQALAAPGPLPASTACTGLGTGAVNCELWARPGTLSLPGAVTVPVWGYADAAANPAQVPGPTLIANSGDTVTVTLHNDLAVTTSLDFIGQPLAPDLTGAAAAGVVTYTFTAVNPGTFLYEAGPLPNAQYQVPMGLYGSLIVRPTIAPTQTFTNPASAFTDEALVALSEIDPALNNSATPSSFDMRLYSPRYRLINGKAYPQTDEIPVPGGASLLLRYVNAGQETHSMSLLGVPAQTFLSRAGEELPYYRRLVSELMTPGQTADALVSVPAIAPGAPTMRYGLYDSSLLLRNSGAGGFGGMLTFVTVSGTLPTGDTTGPATTGLAVSPNPTEGAVDVNLTGNASDVGRGDSAIAAAEYFIDTPGATGTGAAMTVIGTGAATASVTGTISAATLGPLPAGNHPIYVHGQDAVGNWGPLSTVYLNLDKAGPATTGVTFTPPASNGTANVVMQATGDDTATGGSNVTEAEYFIDPASLPDATTRGTAMSVTTSGPVVSLDATIISPTIAALAEGQHVVNLRSKDALLNWGAFVTATLQVDKTGPVADPVQAQPNPTNGKVGVNPITPSVQVSVTLTDPLAGGAQSAIMGAEGFLTDTLGSPAPGTGFAFMPLDGVFDQTTEAAYAYIPLTQISALSDGPHPVYVRGKDAAGNWGAMGSVILLVDQTGPSASGLSLGPGPNNVTGILTATVTDPLNGTAAASIIAGAEWFDGADPGPGNGTPMAAADGTFDSASESVIVNVDVTGWISGAQHTIMVRGRDAGGNWGPVSTRAVMRYDYELWETTGTDFNWVGLPVDVGLATAADLVTHIQGHSNVTLTVSSVQRWNATGQNYQTYSLLPFPSGDFNLALANAYRVTVNVTGAAPQSATWTLVGNVPPAAAFSYTLQETTGTDFNWVLLPFSKDILTMASHLRTDMEADAVPALTVSAAQEWNGQGQNFHTFSAVPVPSGDFPIQLGRPYRVTVNVTGVPSGSSVWP